jgi:hypothetical protein
MSTPPNIYTTPAVWQLWEAISAAIGYRVKLGGIYANKSGYHNTRNANRARWPSNYSIQLDLDKQGPADKAAAIDLTFSSVTDMKKYTKLLADAFDKRDPRLASVKEFYGTLDGSEVYGLGKKSREGEPYETSADDSHLWHLHVSFFRADVEDWERIKGVGEVLTGKSFGDSPSTPNNSGESMFPTYGDKSDEVERTQRRFEALGYEFPKYGHDGSYGNEMKTVVKQWFKDRWSKDYHGEKMTAWMMDELEVQYISKRLEGKFKGPKGDPGPAGKDGVLKLPLAVTINGQVTAAK